MRKTALALTILLATSGAVLANGYDLSHTMQFPPPDSIASISADQAMESMTPTKPAVHNMVKTHRTPAKVVRNKGARTVVPPLK